MRKKSSFESYIHNQHTGTHIKLGNRLKNHVFIDSNARSIIVHACVMCECVFVGANKTCIKEVNKKKTYSSSNIKNKSHEVYKIQTISNSNTPYSDHARHSAIL